jgi:hypothetical protein
MSDNLNFNVMAVVSVIGKIFSWLFGTAVFAAGLINTFWGNDPFFGIFLIFVAVFYFLPLEILIKLTKKITRISIGPGMTVLVKVLVGIFIFIAVLGVGELFAKIDMMMADFNAF